MKPSKYKAVRTTNAEGVVFASKKEARRDAELKLLERAGKIFALERQPRFPLKVEGKLIATYVADWRYLKAGWHIQTVEDAKGVQTPAFRLKWKLAQALNPFYEWIIS